MEEQRGIRDVVIAVGRASSALPPEMTSGLKDVLRSDCLRGDARAEEVLKQLR